MFIDNHVSDEQLQLLLDSTESSDKAELLAHIDSCDSCRKTYLQYQLLIKLASQPESIDLSPGFATRVAAIAVGDEIAEKQNRLESKISNWLVPLAASIGAISIWAYFAGWSSFWETTLSGFLRGYYSVTKPLSGLSVSLDFLGDSTGLILVAGLVVVLFGSMDKIIRALAKARHIHISFV